MRRRQGETSYKETAFGVIPRSRLVLLEIDGIQRAWNFVLETIQSKTNITPHLLREIHKIGFGWIFPDMGGRFRRIDVEVSDHQPPIFYRVPQLMEDFCEDITERLKHLPTLQRSVFFPELIGLLAWTHHRFLWIHPFQDYNGRLARLLTNVILLKLRLPPIELKVETKAGRTKYIQALQKGDQGDLVKLEKLLSQAIDEAVMELKK